MTYYIIGVSNHPHFGGGRFIYPQKDRSYTKKQKATLLDLMTQHLLGFLAQGATGSEEIVHEELAPELAKLLTMDELDEKIAKAKKISDVISAMQTKQVDWPNSMSFTGTSAMWGMFLEEQDIVAEAIFHRKTEAKQILAFARLKELGFASQFVSQQLQILMAISETGNVSYALDQIIFDTLFAIPLVDLRDLVKEKSFYQLAEKLVSSHFYHPLIRKRTAARIMGALSFVKERADFIAATMPSKMHRDTWNAFFDATPVGINAADFALMQAALESTRKKEELTKTGRTVAAEFMARMEHVLSVLAYEADAQVFSNFLWYLNEPEKNPLTDDSKEFVRKKSAESLGGRDTINYPFEEEFLRLYQSLNVDERKMVIHAAMMKHKDLFDHKDFKAAFSNTPIFAAEKSTSFNRIKAISWQHLTWTEKSLITSLILNNPEFRGPLAENDELIIQILEALNTVGRKGAQNMVRFGHFLRPELKVKMNKFRDRNEHSDIMALIESLEDKFRQSLGLNFWDEVEEVVAVLAAGSLKTTLLVRLRDHRLAVMKIVDPIVERRAQRNLSLSRESIGKWIEGEHEDPLHGTILYIMKRIEEAVGLELDLDVEYHNTLRHAENILRRQDGHATPLKTVDELCSKDILTVKYIDFKENANQMEMSPKERENLVAEVLAQIFTDQFAHGDLQNPANILLLKNSDAPALIDLSMSRDIRPEDLRAIVAIYQDVTLLMNAQKSWWGKIAGKLSWAALKAIPNQYAAAAERIKANLEKALRYTAPSKEGQKVELNDLMITSIFSQILERMDKKEISNFYDILGPLEEAGLIFKDEFMFVLELGAVVYDEQVKLLDSGVTGGWEKLKEQVDQFVQDFSKPKKKASSVAASVTTSRPNVIAARQKKQQTHAATRAAEKGAQGLEDKGASPEPLAGVDMYVLKVGFFADARNSATIGLDELMNEKDVGLVQFVWGDFKEEGQESMDWLTRHTVEYLADEGVKNHVVLVSDPEPWKRLGVAIAPVKVRIDESNWDLDKLKAHLAKVSFLNVALGSDSKHRLRKLMSMVSALSVTDKILKRNLSQETSQKLSQEIFQSGLFLLGIFARQIQYKVEHERPSLINFTDLDPLETGPADMHDLTSAAAAVAALLDEKNPATNEYGFSMFYDRQEGFSFELDHVKKLEDATFSSPEHRKEALALRSFAMDYINGHYSRAVDRALEDFDSGELTCAKAMAQ